MRPFQKSDKHVQAFFFNKELINIQACIFFQLFKNAQLHKLLNTTFDHGEHISSSNRMNDAALRLRKRSKIKESV